MKGFVIAEITVTDPAAFERYRQAVPATIAAHGGRYLVRGGRAETLEGAGTPGRLVIVEFESAARARQWVESPEYREVTRLRENAAEVRMLLVEGVPAAV